MAAQPGGIMRKGLIVLWALSVSVSAEAGVRIALQSVDKDGLTSDQRLQFQGDKMRADHSSQAVAGGEMKPGHTMIFDGSLMISVNHEAKSYTVIDPVQLKAQLDRMKASLPPEQQAKIEQAMAAQSEPKQATFKKAAGGDSSAGYSCSNYTMQRSGNETATVCVTSWTTGPVKKSDLSALSKFSETMVNIPATVKKELFTNPDTWPGFPLVTHGSNGQVVRVKSITREAIPDSEFQPPANYTRKADPMMGRGMAP
jgi:hypothetical protein